LQQLQLEFGVLQFGREVLVLVPIDPAIVEFFSLLADGVAIGQVRI
jgi:hypothetical protein